MRQTSNAYYNPQGFTDIESFDGSIIPGEWRASTPTNTFEPIRPIRGSRPKEDCTMMRYGLRDYLNSQRGSVSWQVEYVRRTYKKT